jgi:pimeloyl-ACP methyl ester carboxylesterase
MRSLAQNASSRDAAVARLVWLPGAGQAPEDFLREGFATRAAARAAPVDLIFVDLALEHVADRGWRERLHRDIIAPARAGGAGPVLLGGISLGGYFALDYAGHYPEDLDGLCLLAPYLGNRQVIAAVAESPTTATLANFDEEQRIWRLIQSLPERALPVYLGYGAADRFAAAHALLARWLPTTAVQVVNGGHDWPTWTKLWEMFLDSSIWHTQMRIKGRA